MKPSPAEQLLIDMGISEPSEINLSIIARRLGAKIKDRRLSGCEARIVGEGDRAIISIDDRVSPRRRRFSIAHELGHWMCHRGFCLACQKTDIGRGGAGREPKERAADKYAADLLMPRFLLKHVTKSHGRLSVAMLQTVAETFDVSRSAAALRLVATEVEPSVLIRHSRIEPTWRVVSPSVDRRWWPRATVEPGSHAYDILFNGASDQTEAAVVSAEDWFENDGADSHELIEQSFRSRDGEVFTLLTIIDEAMLAS